VVGGALVVLLAALPILAARAGASAGDHGDRRASEVARESSPTADTAGLQDARPRSPHTARTEVLGTLAVASMLLAAGSVAIAAATRRRRNPDPVASRAPARAPPSTAFACAR
jgi:hypothetical protein